MLAKQQLICLAARLGEVPSTANVVKTAAGEKVPAERQLGFVQGPRIGQAQGRAPRQLSRACQCTRASYAERGRPTLLVQPEG